MQCVDDMSQYGVSGILGGNFGSALVLSLYRCEGPNCKPKEDIDDYLKKTKLVLKLVYS